MPKSVPITIEIADAPAVKAALAEGAAAIRELTALKAAIRRRHADAEGILEGIEMGTVIADVEGLTRAKIEADVWDEAASLIDEPAP
jgi:hypothetical protein